MARKNPSRPERSPPRPEDYETYVDPLGVTHFLPRMKWKRVKNE